MSAAERVRGASMALDRAVWGLGHTTAYADVDVAKGELAAAVRAETLAEVREAVEGMRRWDMVDIDGIEWSIGHDLEGEYLYRSDVLATLSKMEAP